MIQSEMSQSEMSQSEITSILANIIYNKFYTTKYITNYDFHYEIPNNPFMDGIPSYSFLSLKLKHKCIELCIHSDNIFDDNDPITYYEKNLFEDSTIFISENQEDDGDHNISHDNTKHVCYSIEDITIALNNLFINIVPNLKFSKLIGKFITNSDTDILEIEAWNTILSKNSNIKLKYEECSVCYELTKTKTKCKHPLCYKCWEKIIENLNGESEEDAEEDEEEEELIPVCPICRKSICTNF